MRNYQLVWSNCYFVLTKYYKNANFWPQNTCLCAQNTKIIYTKVLICAHKMVRK